MAGPSVNLLAYLRPQQVSVSFHGHVWPLQAATAAQWLGAVAYDLRTLGGVFPGLIEEDSLDLMADILRLNPDSHETLILCAQKALGAGAGRDWWWALNLARKALNGWMMVNGFLLRQNVNSNLLSFPDWLDACYTLLWERSPDDQARTALDMELGIPPQGAKVHQSKEQTRAMLASFAAD